MGMRVLWCVSLHVGKCVSQNSLSLIRINLVNLGRLAHFATHYEDPAFTSFESLNIETEIEGLLKQNQAGFDIASEWQNARTGNPYIGWDKEDAILLRDRLEHHEGTASQIAELARALSMKRHQNISLVPR